MVEKHEYGGRILEISDESRADNKLKDVVKRAILEFFHRHALAYKLRNWVIVLSDSGDENNEELGLYEDGKIYIYLNVVVLGLLRGWISGEAGVFNAVIESLSHESAHAISYQTYKVERFAREVTKRLEQAALNNPALKGIGDDFTQWSFSFLRSLPNVFLSYIFEEGIAKFIGEYAAGRVDFNQPTFNLSYATALGARVRKSPSG